MKYSKYIKRATLALPEFKDFADKQTTPKKVKGNTDHKRASTVDVPPQHVISLLSDSEGEVSDDTESEGDVEKLFELSDDGEGSDPETKKDV